jgi:hypothetical protein
MPSYFLICLCLITLRSTTVCLYLVNNYLFIALKRYCSGKDRTVTVSEGFHIVFKFIMIITHYSFRILIFVHLVTYCLS